MPKARLAEDVDLFYTSDGDGDEVALLIHGWACDSHDWLYQIPFLAQRYRVLTPDLRGHGGSTVAADGYDPRELARDLRDLLDLLDIPEVIAIGHSLGGFIASILAVEYPERVSAVVCLDPAYGYVDEDMAGYASLVTAYDSGLDHEQLTSAAFGGLHEDMTPPFLGAWHARRAAATPRTVVVETFRHIVAVPDPLCARSAITPYLAGRACPTLTIRAQASHELVDWERTLPNMTHDDVMRLPTGHWPHQDAPDLVNALIGEWLEGVRETPSA